MNKISVREDFRRDGLCMNFLVNADLMLNLANSFPNGVLYIGYPLICSEEAKRCKEITLKLSDQPIESAVVGHALKSHIKVMADITNLAHNTSATFWIPFSDEMIGKTLNISSNELLEHTIKMVKYWKNISDRPIDIALVDATANELHLNKRLSIYYESLKNVGVRSIIVCDTKGIAVPSTIEELLSLTSLSEGDIELHPHNDNNQAMGNIDMAIKLGVRRIGTAIYGHGERSSMIDPRALIKKYNVEYNSLEFMKFEMGYKNLLQNLNEDDYLFESDYITTGTQYRLWGRDSDKRIVFSVTSDKYILSELSSIKISDISDALLSYIKDCMYKEKKRTLNSQELIRKIEIYQKSELLLYR